jgi:DNA mismatch repair protein MutS2
VTTHFGALKKFADDNRFIANASMLFDEQILEPLYVLSIGRPGSSYTFHIAKKMGLQEQLIENAKKLVQTDQVKYDHLLLKLEIKEKDLIKKQRELEQAERDLKSQIKNWNKVNNELELLRNKIKFERMLFQNEKEIEKEKEIRAFAEELKKQQKEEDIKEERRQIQEKIAENAEQIKETYKQIHNVPSNQNFQIGSWVRYIQTQAMGKIEKIERKKAIIIFDNIKSTIPLSDLILVPDDEIKKQHIPRKVTIEKVQLSDELDLRGMFVAEAIPELEKYINDALVQNKFQSKIIHGRGNLKREVLKTINSIKSIAKIAHAEPEHGGDGVTYIYF